MTCEVIDMMRSIGNGGPMTAMITRTSTRSILLESALRGNVVFSLFLALYYWWARRGWPM